jgi:hypothetical protein
MCRRDACRITYTSDYFSQMVEIAKNLIRAGHMYADNTDVDTMREERLKCVESKARGMPAAEAERVFDEMLKGSEVWHGLRALELGTVPVAVIHIVFTRALERVTITSRRGAPQVLMLCKSFLEAGCESIRAR